MCWNRSNGKSPGFLLSFAVNPKVLFKIVFFFFLNQFISILILLLSIFPKENLMIKKKHVCLND